MDEAIEYHLMMFTNIYVSAILDTQILYKDDSGKRGLVEIKLLAFWLSKIIPLAYIEA